MDRTSGAARRGSILLSRTLGRAAAPALISNSIYSTGLSAPISLPLVERWGYRNAARERACMCYMNFAYATRRNCEIYRVRPALSILPTAFCRYTAWCNRRDIVEHEYEEPADPACRPLGSPKQSERSGAVGKRSADGRSFETVCSMSGTLYTYTGLQCIRRSI